MSEKLPPLPDFPRLLPQGDDPWAHCGETGLADVEPGREALDFTPVPRLRRRRNGWTEETQRLFILALSECGCVTRAARAVGMSARSAYRLLEAEGADGFAAAWDQAIARGIERLREQAMERAFSAAWVPVYRKGRLVRVELRHNDRLAIALLSGRESSVAENRERAASRRRYRLALAAQRRAEADEEARLAALQAAYDAELERMTEQARRRPRPRIRSL